MKNIKPFRNPYYKESEGVEADQRTSVNIFFNFPLLQITWFYFEPKRVLVTSGYLTYRQSRSMLLGGPSFQFYFVHSVSPGLR